MQLTHVKRSNYAKWSGSCGTHTVYLEFRPNLDKWDVVSIDNTHLGKYNWYLFKKTERFSTMYEAVLFILTRLTLKELKITDRFSTEVTTYNLKEFEMNEKAVSNITLIYGKDSRLVKDDEVFGHIKHLENKIKELTSIEHKPKKLDAKIKSIEQDIAELVAVVDGR